MRSVSKETGDAFWAGRRSEELPFVVNDAVEILGGPHVQERGAVISIELTQPELAFLIELGSDGREAVVAASLLRLLSNP
jgi:hypothetical protein